MHLSTRTVSLTVPTIFFGVVACNSDRASAPPDTVLTDRQVSADVAASQGEAIASDLASLLGSAQLSGIFSVEPGTEPRRSTSPGPESSASTCVYTSGRWTCPAVVENGLTIVRTYAYFNALGEPMKVRDDIKTASANFTLGINGTVVKDTSFSGVVHRTRDVTVSGLLGAETTRRWDGFGVSADTNTYHNDLTTRRYAGKSVDSLKAVVYAQPRTPTSYPLSGSTVMVVSYTVTASGKTNEKRSVDRRVVVTYNGSATARLESGLMTCNLHLDTHKVDGCTSG